MFCLVNIHKGGLSINILARVVLINYQALKNLKKFLKNKKNKTKKKEKGCVEPLYGKKSKCVIKIVPKDKKVPTFQMDEKCKKKRSK